MTAPSSILSPKFVTDSVWRWQWARAGLTVGDGVDNANARRYYSKMAIRSFKCAETRALFGGDRVRRFVNIEQVAMRRLAMLNRAGRLDDLRVPPGNRLEALKRDRTGQHSIRVNEQFRVCFVWTAEGPEDVEIVDYH